MIKVPVYLFLSYLSFWASDWFLAGFSKPFNWNAIPLSLLGLIFAVCTTLFFLNLARLGKLLAKRYLVKSNTNPSIFMQKRISADVVRAMMVKKRLET